MAGPGARTPVRARTRRPPRLPRQIPEPCGAPDRIAPATSRSFPRLIEISQIRRGLIFLGGHQVPFRAQEIVVLPDAGMLIVFRTDDLAPHGMPAQLAAVVLGHGPGPRQSMVDGR